jgi:Flp pilus assembly protein TadD
VRKSPDFAPAKNELAVALHQHGRFAEANRILKTNYADKSIKNSELALINRAGALADTGDPEGAHALLAEALNSKGAHNELVLRKLVDLVHRRIKLAKDPVQAAAQRRELAGFLRSLAEQTGDPFYWYQIGQNYLALGENRLAGDSFSKAYLTAPVGAYYRQPAKALADRLAAGAGIARTPVPTPRE